MSRLVAVGEKRKNPVPIVREAKKTEKLALQKSPPSISKQMTDEQLAKFLQQQEELLLYRDENIIPLNNSLKAPTNHKELSKDEQLAWKLQMEEKYYEELLNTRESNEFVGNDIFLDSSEEINEEEQTPNTFNTNNSSDANFIPFEDDSIDYIEDNTEEQEENEVFGTYEELLNLEEIAPSVSRGIKEDDLKNLNTFNIKKEDVVKHDKCNVCLEEFEENEECRELKCKHVYHKICIDNWLKINKICPVCRKEIV